MNDEFLQKAEWGNMIMEHYVMHEEDFSNLHDHIERMLENEQENFENTIEQLVSI